ncbi:MAG: efflux RND transporter periplasmic adaptor subunit [Candidatus Krumholzibacteriota bacterium]|nr:efflux RND transporter periplasmic adaptor subunit [Candidatus Krumholzibacteriota bacterium]
MTDRLRTGRRRHLVLPGAAILAAFLMGWALRGAPDPADPNAVGRAARAAAGHDHATEAREWTCSMHPQVRQAGPGRCPLCGMDLVPVAAAGGGELGPRELRLSEAARALAEVALAPVERRHLARPLRLPGRVEVDETRRRTITAWAPGRVERLHVDFVGARVERGAPLLELNSPLLAAAQEELLQARRLASSDAGAVSGADGGAVPARAGAAPPAGGDGLVAAARERLRQLGLLSEQITALEASGRATALVTVRAPVAGVVLAKHTVEGAAVKTGAPLFTLADLSRVWVMLDAYETDLSWLDEGQAARFTAAALPGETFAGRVTFVDPVLDAGARTLRLRVEADNPDGRLRPGMFVRAELLAATGDPAGGAAPLVVPATAPLLTGRRAVVYVAHPEEVGRYEGREVTLGPRLGDHYVVRSGLAEGERVVVRGNFKIDSAMQILARPSMMNPDGDGAAPSELARGLEPVYAAYLAIQAALADDDRDLARAAAGRLAGVLPPPSPGWSDARAALASAAGALAGAADIAGARAAFEELSAAAIAVARVHGRAGGALAIYHCPMAFDNRGADWLQAAGPTANPYFGAAMLRCGSVTERFAAQAAAEPRDG